MYLTGSLQVNHIRNCVKQRHRITSIHLMKGREQNKPFESLRRESISDQHRLHCIILSVAVTL